MSEVWKCPWCGGEMTEAHTFCEDAVRDEADRISALEAALAKADELAGLLHAATTSRAQDDLEWQIDARDTLTAYRQARDATR